MFVADKWSDYEIMYAGAGEKYERWGDVVLRRPDPQAVWPVFADGRPASMDDLPAPDAIYHRSDKGGGSWTRNKSIPQSWKINYDCLGKNLTFGVEPTLSSTPVCSPSRLLTGTSAVGLSPMLLQGAEMTLRS